MGNSCETVLDLLKKGMRNSCESVICLSFQRVFVTNLKRANNDTKSTGKDKMIKRL